MSLMSELAERWLDVGLRGRFDGHDPFLRFIATWISFNALYASLSNESSDWRQIECFANESRARQSHESLLTMEAYREAIEILKDRGVYSERHGVNREIHDLSDLPSVLSCVYQIRCNLFHGYKDTDDARDRILCKAGFVVIANLLWMYQTGDGLPLSLDERTWEL